MSAAGRVVLPLGTGERSEYMPAAEAPSVRSRSKVLTLYNYV